jgi:glycosyltransferase involved in cell wall biosynthesis
VSVLLKHPLQAGALILASVIEQITACMLLLHFVNRAERGTRKPEVWFAAAIPGDSQGGVMRNMRAFADGLRSRGWRTRLLCGDPAHPCNYLSFAVKLLTAYLRHAIRPPQLLLARSTDAVFVAACAKLLRLDTRIILHNHGWEERIDALERRAAHLPQPAPHTTFRARILRFPLLRLTLRMSDGVLCGTVSDARWLRRSHAHCPPVHVVCNGVDKEDVALPQASSDQPNCNFCCVGAWNWRKNAYHSLMAFDLLHEVYPESRLYCIGMEPCDSLERVLARMRHPQSVEIVGTVPMSEMPHWYRRCSFLISSSRFEGGHPLALLEAMAAGCIVFASDIPAHRELLRNRRNGVLIAGISPTDDAAEIVDVLRDSGGSRHMRSRACNTALRYRWERQVSRMERVVWKQIPR